jgi:hypothetical protein
VAVGILALALIVAQVMPGGEPGFDSDFIHGVLGSRVQITS